MKQIYSIISVLFFILNGCSFFYNPADVLVEADKNAKENYEYFTTDKSITKAFEAYEFLDTSCDDEDVDDDFIKRFCDTDYFANNWVKEAMHTCVGGYELGLDNLTKIKLFQLLGNLNATTRVSNEDTRCLALKCEFNGCGYIQGDWINYDDECIIRRRNLLTNKALTQWCAFDYKDYIPEYAKISTYYDFIRLYNSYKKDINECKEKRENFENTSTEYDECIKSVNNKVEEIVKSGILK